MMRMAVNDLGRGTLPVGADAAGLDRDRAAPALRSTIPVNANVFAAAGG